ncbi:lysozyme [Clostridium acidisoli DSM 12555]|uniref:Lysozyme n=1 Tax=Clostridium acidisoli DSM 12555 TaxID=1121291 RepID=A0A1W1WZM3_9CLOT|nr:peptidoglycan-binding protein [Clostridium acidisoli]SMC17095.1 lysozyme [Clostridium acidisoli DSM 12555]
MKGIDIYSETNITDWNAVKASGVEVVYIKLTDGLTYNNPKVEEQYKAAKAVGLKVGGYHFGEKNAPQAEYEHFKSILDKYDWDLKPVLDYEVGIPDMNFVTQFMAQNPNLLLYASHNVADKCGLPKNKIWVAEPNTNPTSTGEYAGIQYAWTGRVNGLQGDADVDLFSDLILAGSASIVAKVQATGPVQSGDPTVRIIQQQLNTLLKKGLAVDSINGPATIAAIKEFQGIMGLVPDGIWGPKTAGAVGQIYSRPTDGVTYAHMEYATRYIQFRCGGSIDGTFGNQTKINVQNWQAKHSLSADGVVGAATWEKLLDENV